MACSFRYERALKEQIEGRITGRGGVMLPVEDRMLQSINHAAKIAGVDLATVDRKRRNWGGKDTRAKAKDVFGSDLAYVGAFAGMSQSVHGSWGDLMQFHIETEDGISFSPRFDWTYPRPQTLTSTAYISTYAVGDMLAHWDVSLAERFEPELADLRDRVRTLSAGHEQYLAKFQWPRIR